MTKYRWAIADLLADSVFDVSSVSSSFVAGWNKLSTDTVDLLETAISMYLSKLSALGLHIIGKYDEEYTGTNAQKGLVKALLWYPSLNKYMPFLMVLDGEFMKLKAEWQTERSNSGRARTTGGSEDSPVNALELSPVADDADWTLDNPIAKYGNKSESETSQSETRIDPELALRMQKYSLENLNITRLTELICNRIVEEYNTIY